MFSNFFFRQTYALWENVAKYNGAGEAKDNMAYARFTLGTSVSEYVIIIEFLPEQWLHERALCFLYFNFTLSCSRQEQKRLWTEWLYRPCRVESLLFYSLGGLRDLIAGVAARTRPLSICRMTDERLWGIGGITDSGTPDYRFQRHFVHHTSHMDCPLSEHSPQRTATTRSESESHACVQLSQSELQSLWNLLLF